MMEARERGDRLDRAIGGWPECTEAGTTSVDRRQSIPGPDEGAALGQREPTV